MRYKPLIGDWTSEVWHAHATQCLSVTFHPADGNPPWSLKFYHPRRRSHRVRWTPGMGPEYTPIVRQEL